MHNPFKSVAGSVANLSARLLDTSPSGQFLLDQFLEESTSIIALCAAHQDGFWRSIEADRAELRDEKDRELRIIESHREAGKGAPDSALAETRKRQGFLRKRMDDSGAAATANIRRKSTMEGYTTEARKYVAANGLNLTPAEVDLPKDMHPLEVITQVRAEETKLREERRTVTAAEMPFEDALRLAVRELSNYSKPMVTTRIRNGKVSLHFPVVEVGAEPRGSGVPNAPDAIAIALATNRAVVEEAVRASLKEQYASIPLTMSASEKHKRLTELDEGILDCQMVECAAVRAARAQGVDAEYRSGLDIRAVLGVEGPQPPRPREGKY